MLHQGAASKGKRPRSAKPASHAAASTDTASQEQAGAGVSAAASNEQPGAAATTESTTQEQANAGAEAESAPREQLWAPPEQPTDGPPAQQPEETTRAQQASGIPPTQQPSEAPSDQQPAGLPLVDWQLVEINMWYVIEEYMRANPQATRIPTQMIRTEVRNRMGLTDEHAEAAKGQMLACIRDAVDRWNERTAQEQADEDLPDVVWQQAQTEQADAAAATEAHNEHADAAAAPKRRRLKTKRPAAVVESSNEQAAAASKQAGEPEFVLDPSLTQSAVQFPFPQAEARTWRVSTLCQQQPATQVPAPPAASQKAQPQEGSARRPRWRSLSSAMPQCVSEDELRWEFIQGKKRCSDWISSTAGQRVVAVYRPADCDGSAVFTPVRSSTDVGDWGNSCGSS